MGLPVTVLPLARADLQHVHSRIECHISKESAEKWFVEIMEVIRDLSFMPERCPLADEAEELGFELRMALYGKRRQVYRILFEIHGETIKVHRIRHAAQDRLAADDFELPIP